MKKLVDFLEEEMKAAFEKAGYDGSFAKVTLSNRPDLCEYQCNGAWHSTVNEKTLYYNTRLIKYDIMRDGGALNEYI